MLVLTRRDRPVRAEADALATDLVGRGVEVSEVQLGPLAAGRYAEAADLLASALDEHAQISRPAGWPEPRR